MDANQEGKPPPLIERPDADTVRLFCPAKLNLALSVGAPRGDGLHPIASWMVPITFGDTLVLHRAGGASRFSVAFADDAPVRQAVDWPAERDLAVRAARAVEAYVGRALPVEAVLSKRIPAGAGLGGGSADAAGMVDGLDRLFGLGLDEPAQRAIAQKLGSDVVFQLAARHTRVGALVSGAGEVIEPLPPAEPVSVMLALPAFGCATAAVYRAFDDSIPATEPRSADVGRVAELARRPLCSDTALFNDLAGPACRVQPGVAAVMQGFVDIGLRPHVTGSGSAVFAVLDDDADAEATQALLADARRAAGCAVVLTRTAAAR